MPKKKKSNERQTSVRVGDITGVKGMVNIAAGNITARQTKADLSAAEIGKLFEQLYAAIEARPGTSTVTKADLKSEVLEVQSAVTQAVAKNEKFDENFISRRFRNIARMAPDILDVVVATLGNPLAGIGVAFKKIAERAKNDA